MNIKTYENSPGWISFFDYLLKKSILFLKN
jgi:hypothetical protein